MSKIASFSQNTWLHRFLGVWGVLAMGVTLALLCALSAGVARIVVHDQRTLATVVRSVLVEKTNEERVHQSYGALRVSSRLQAAAQGKAMDMAAKGYFAHVSPEGREPWFWFDLVGYRFTHAGENLAVRFTDSDAVVRAWMASEGHRANILNADFTETGIGIATGTYKGKTAVYVAQFFGTPADTERGAGAEVSAEKGTTTSYLAEVYGAEAGRDAMLASIAHVVASPWNALTMLCLALGCMVALLFGVSGVSGRVYFSRTHILSTGVIVALCLVCAFGAYAVAHVENVVSETGGAVFAVP